MTNFANRTIWTGDNLPIMRGMNSGSVDLIYLDPPFNSKANYAAPIGSKAAGAEFKDTWTLNDVDVEWIDLFEQKHPRLWRMVQAALTDSDKAYLTYMAVRLLEMRRLLKDTGSIYLHCDPTMSHYLKLVMDAVFGRANFRNEIIWLRTKVRKAVNQWGNVSDTILFYSQGGFNPQYLPIEEAASYHHYRHKDEVGVFRSGPVDSPSGGYRYELGMGEKMPKKGYRMPKSRALEMLAEGRLVVEEGKVPRSKLYLHESKGPQINSVWVDVTNVQGSSKERTGYPTQKPLKLLDRIIKASSNPGDVVFDPFCGCATTLVAADRLDRQWVGVDISDKAAALVVQRMEQDQGLWRDVTHRTDIPRRTDMGRLGPYNSKKNREALYGRQGGHCRGCDSHFESRHLEIDHIIARSKGGTDHIENLQLLCGHCNRVKGDRGMGFLKRKLEIVG